MDEINTRTCFESRDAYCHRTSRGQFLTVALLLLLLLFFLLFSPYGTNNRMMIVIEKFSLSQHPVKSIIECNFNKGIGMENKEKCCEIKATQNMVSKIFNRLLSATVFNRS